MQALLHDPASFLTLPSDSAAWQTSACPLCQAERWSPVLQAPDPLGDDPAQHFGIVQCRACGLVFTNPRPGPAAIGRYYPDSYGPHQADRQRLQRRSHRDRRVPWHGQGRLLDFGCGSGRFLHALERRGWQVVGLDVSPAAIQHVREELGLAGLVGTLPHPELEPESFDVVTMWHSLEHLHDPLASLREVYRLLVPGGRLYVEVPNFGSWGLSWFGKAWYGLELPRHLTHFTPGTLRRLLEGAGFRTGPVQMVPRVNWVRYSLALAQRRGQRVPGRWWLQSKLGARLVNWHFNRKQRGEVIRVVAERPA